MKRYRIGDESMNEEMFDYNVLVVLNRLTRRGDSASVYAVARSMYARPNGRTFDNVRESLKRGVRRREVRSNDDIFPDEFQIIPRRTR